MENNALYTRCPTCTTAFKVTEKLLNAAAGKVRCGACLAIFQATDYMLKPSERNNNPDSATPVQTQQPASTLETSDQSVDSVAADSESNQITSEPETETVQKDSPPLGQTPISDEFESEPEFEPLAQSTEQLDFEPEPDFENQSTIEPNLDTQALPPQGDLSDTESSADPEINLDVVTDVEHDFLSTGEGQYDAAIESEASLESTDQLSDFDYKSQSDEFDDEPAEFDQVVEQNGSANQSDSHVEAEHGELRTEPSLGEAVDIDLIDEDLTSDSQQILEATTGVSTSDLADHDLNLIDQSEDLESIREVDTDIQIQQPDEFEVDDLSGQLAEQMQDTDAEPDPLDEFENIIEEKDTTLRRNIILAAVAVLIFIGLQQVWSNRQALAWNESWGGTVKSVCQYLPCNLKARRDVSKIRLLQRQLAPDEENEKLLDVKVLLTNEASFDQPYPTIKIAFSNKNGEQVSIKSFTPKDYLEADSLNKLMPHGTEVHIHFKTEFSHPDALGFEFIFE